MLMDTDEPTGKISELPQHVVEANLRALDRQVEKDSYLSKHSYMCGWVDLYTPEDAPASEWGSRPWVIEVEKDAESGKAKTYRVKAEHAQEAFVHIGLLPYRKEWLYTPEKLVPNE